jgi:GntR family histidine utilization transcriptional repressor
MILDGTYGPGDKLPRDEDLAESLGCSRATVQRAMRALAESGRVERVRKGGTTVRADPVTRATLDIPITRLEVEHKGAQYGYQLIGKIRADTPPPIMANFELAQPETMLRVEALHLADRRPFIYEDRWISLATVPEIATVDLTRQSANEWLVRNRPYSRCDLRFYARNATADDAPILDVAAGSALLVIERTTWIGTAPITTVRAITTPGYQLVTRI